MVAKRTFFFQGLIFRFHVKFRGCIPPSTLTHTSSSQGFPILPSAEKPSNNMGLTSVSVAPTVAPDGPQIQRPTFPGTYAGRRCEDNRHGNRWEDYRPQLSSSIFQVEMFEFWEKKKVQIGKRFIYIIYIYISYIILYHIIINYIKSNYIILYYIISYHIIS